MSYEAVKAHGKVDYRYDFSLVGARIPDGVHRVLEIDE